MLIETDGESYLSCAIVLERILSLVWSDLFLTLNHIEITRIHDLVNAPGLVKCKVVHMVKMGRPRPCHAPCLAWNICASVRGWNR